MALPTEVSISSHRPVIGKLIVAYKRLVKLLISPYLRSLLEERDRALTGRFDGLTRDLLGRTDALFANLEQRIEALRAGREKARAEFFDYISSEEFTGLQKKALAGHFLTMGDVAATEHFLTRDDVAATDVALDDLSREIALHKRRLDVILGEISGKSAQGAAGAERIAFERARLYDHAYVNFENRFRGSRDLIKAYEGVRPALERALRTAQGCSILDAGCGRGELLELSRKPACPHLE